MNVPLLRRIQRQIDKAPHAFSMGQVTEEKECGTAYCIAGWALVLHYGHLRDLTYQDTRSSKERAQEVLDVSPTEMDRLFITFAWPRQFQAPDGTPELPALAIARIDHFIATEGRE